MVEISSVDIFEFDVIVEKEFSVVSKISGMSSVVAVVAVSHSNDVSWEVWVSIDDFNENVGLMLEYSVFIIFGYVVRLYICDACEGFCSAVDCEKL